ncbi:hypothetical protein BCL76_108177 [Streptomyces sp. CG 926]|uniref:hypothetical protein n=1 Tax=Streptomyces sp. CG 926 TaxID=1882405 RepID=UPI000D6C3293|nr:hypothetical protein [Streptomyces sp. CG 926]PWK67861.1 hypothetical protein BCL76_108177 [Streptomyces sp. CG 926]
MTNEQILAACRSNWAYRGVAEADMREMLDELSAHLADAEAAGRTARDVVGPDVRAFAAAWARERAPLTHRALRTTAMACYVLGCLPLFTFLVHRTTAMDVRADYLAFWAAIGAVTIAWELRRGSLRMYQQLLISLVVGLPVMILVKRLTGEGVLFTLPLWAVPILVLPALPYIYADTRARRNAKRDAARPH